MTVLLVCWHDAPRTAAQIVGWLALVVAAAAALVDRRVAEPEPLRRSVETDMAGMGQSTAGAAAIVPQVLWMADEQRSACVTRQVLALVAVVCKALLRYATPRNARTRYTIAASVEEFGLGCPAVMEGHRGPDSVIFC